MRRSRLAYRRRRDRLIAALERHAAEARIAGIAAGLRAIVELPAGGKGDEQAVVARAAEHGLALEGLAAYRAVERGHGPALVVGYGTPPEHAFPGSSPGSPRCSAAGRERLVRYTRCRAMRLAP